MGVEQASVQEISQNVYDEMKRSDDTPGELTSKEKQDLIEKYTCEKEGIEAETCGNLQELQEVIAIFEEAQSLGKENIRKIQMILSVPKSGRDGVFGPGTFSKFELFKSETGFSGTMNELISLWNEKRVLFKSIDDSQERKALQPEGGKDGNWGQGTFRYMISEQGMGVDSEVPVSEIDEEVKTETPDTSINTQKITETIPTEQIVDTAEEIPRDHHPEEMRSESELQAQTETLTDEEKIENFITDAKDVPRVLIRFLQAGIGTGVDGAFGPKSARAATEKYPDAQSLEEIMQQEGIPMESDEVLPIHEDTPEGKREVFRELYGDFVDILGENVQLPQGLIEAIIRQETKHGTYGGLISNTGCKGMMQLSRNATQDMLTGHRGAIRNYRESFRNLELDKLMSLPVGKTGKTIEQSIPKPIVQTLYLLHNPTTSNKDYNKGIQQLENFIKLDNSYFNHAVNMILGSVYLSGTYHDNTPGYGGMGDITQTADHYNAAPGEREEYKAYVTEFFREYHQEPNYDKTSSESIPSDINLGPDDGLRGERVNYSELRERYGDKLSKSMDWIENNLSDFMLERLALYFNLNKEDASFLEKLSIRIMDFQENNGLAIDGKPGQKTLGKVDFSSVDTELIPGNNLEFIEAMLPQEWQEIGKKFVEKLHSNEVLTPNTSIQLFNPETSQGIYCIDGEYREVPIIDGNGATLRDTIHRVDQIILGDSPNVDASNSGNSSTVRGSTFISESGRSDGGKWAPHGTDPYRNGWGTTKGCIGIDTNILMEITQDTVLKTGASAIQTHTRDLYESGNKLRKIGTSKITRYSVPPGKVFTYTA